MRWVGLACVADLMGSCFYFGVGGTNLSCKREGVTGQVEDEVEDEVKVKHIAAMRLLRKKLTRFTPAGERGDAGV